MAIYYVDAVSGSDSNSGLSEALAWQTIGKAETESISMGAGDFILFKSGQTFPSNFIYTGSAGTLGNEFVLSSYGSGARPIIGAHHTESGTWTSIGDNLWTISSTCGYSRMWRNDIEIGKVGQLSGVDDLNEIGSTIAIYGYVSGTTTIYSITDPNLDTFTYVGDVTTIDLNQNYMKISSLDVRYGASSTVRVSGLNCSILHSNVGKDAATGILSVGSNTLRLERVLIDANFFLDFTGVAEYRTANALSMTGTDARGCNEGLVSYSGMNNATIKYNTFKNWGHAHLAMTSFNSGDGCTGNVITYNHFDGNNLKYCRAIGYSGDHITLNEIAYNYITNMSARSQLNGVANHIHHNHHKAIINTPYKIGEQGQAIGLENYNGDPVNNVYEYNTIELIESAGIELIASGNAARKIQGNIFNKNLFLSCGTNPYYSNATNKGIKVQDYVDILDNTYTDNAFPDAGDTVVHRNVECTPSEFNARNGTSGDVISGNTTIVTDQGANLDLSLVGVDASENGYQLVTTPYSVKAIGSDGTIYHFTDDGATQLVWVDDVPSASTPLVGNIELNKLMTRFGTTEITDFEVYLGTLKSGTLPSAITDFNATDNEVGQITVTFSNATGNPTPTYNLIDTAGAETVLATDISSGYIFLVGESTFNLRVDAVNTAGTTPSNVDSGTSIAQATLSAPSAIVDFNATDTEVGQVTATWSDATGNPTPTYDIYRDWNLLVAGVTSPYVDTTGVVGQTYTYKVHAVNSQGFTASNDDTGTSV